MKLTITLSAFLTMLLLNLNLYSQDTRIKYEEIDTTNLKIRNERPNFALILIKSDIPLDLNPSNDSINEHHLKTDKNYYYYYASPPSQVLTLKSKGLIETDIELNSIKPKDVRYYAITNSPPVPQCKLTYKDITDSRPQVFQTYNQNDALIVFFPPPDRPLSINEIKISSTVNPDTVTTKGDEYSLYVKPEPQTLTVTADKLKDAIVPIKSLTPKENKYFILDYEVPIRKSENNEKDVKKGDYKINSIPPGARIEMEGNKEFNNAKNITPYTLQGEGEKVIRLYYPEFETFDDTIKFGDKKNSYTYKLEPKPAHIKFDNNSKVLSNSKDITKSQTEQSTKPVISDNNSMTNTQPEQSMKADVKDNNGITNSQQEQSNKPEVRDNNSMTNTQPEMQSQGNRPEFNDNIYITNSNVNSSKFRNYCYELSPYGTWINNPDYGYVWVPRAEPGFAPYRTNGQWVNTEQGWYWNSYYEWGQIPFHYGRWFNHPTYGWVWVPGYEQAPAWVTWSNYENQYGWAPMEPNAALNSEYKPPTTYWTFIPREHIQEENVSTYEVNNTTIYRNNITVINNTNSQNRTYYNSGPQATDVEKMTGRKVVQYKADELKNKPQQKDVFHNKNNQTDKIPEKSQQQTPLIKITPKHIGDINKINNNKNTQEQPIRTEPQQSGNQQIEKTKPNHLNQLKGTEPQQTENQQIQKTKPNHLDELKKTEPRQTENQQTEKTKPNHLNQLKSTESKQMENQQIQKATPKHLDQINSNRMINENNNIQPRTIPNNNNNNNNLNRNIPNNNNNNLNRNIPNNNNNNLNRNIPNNNNNNQNKTIPDNNNQNKNVPYNNNKIQPKTIPYNNTKSQPKTIPINNNTPTKTSTINNHKSTKTISEPTQKTY